MKTVSIGRVHKGKEIPQDMWASLLSFKSKMDINMMGFSDREVRYVDHSMNEIIFNVADQLVDDFTLAICEASGCDFTYTLKSI